MPTVHGDGIELAQLFQNLIGNAIKFRGDAPPKISIDACRNDDHWLISVRDNGIGIDSEYRDRIFLIFQRLHSRKLYPEPASDWRSAGELSIVTAAGFGLNLNLDKGPLFTLQFRNRNLQ